MGYNIGLRSLDSERPIVEVHGFSHGGSPMTPIASGDGFVVISLKGENVNIVTTGLNATGIADMLRRLYGGIPQIVEKLSPPAPSPAPAIPAAIPMFPQPAQSQVTTQRIEIPNEILVKLLKQRGLDVSTVESQLAKPAKVDHP